MQPPLADRTLQALRLRQVCCESGTARHNSCAVLDDCSILCQHTNGHKDKLCVFFPSSTRSVVCWILTGQGIAIEPVCAAAGLKRFLPMEVQQQTVERSMEGSREEASGNKGALSNEASEEDAKLFLGGDINKQSATSAEV